MNNIAIYTSIFGGYDTLKEPLYTIGNADLICFADTKQKNAADYTVKIRNQSSEDPRREAKKYKILSHEYLPQYEYTLWVDGSALPLFDDVEYLVQKYLRKHDIAFFKHPWRNNIFEEAEECIKLELDSAETIRKQISAYKNDGFDDKDTLYAGTIILRKNSPKVKTFNKAWWEQIRKYSIRDQISLPYVLWKMNLEVAVLGDSHISSPYFKLFDHIT